MKLLAAAAALALAAAPAHAYMEDYEASSAQVLNMSTAEINLGLAAAEAGDHKRACTHYTQAYTYASYANTKLVPNPYWFKLEPMYQAAINRYCF